MYMMGRIECIVAVIPCILIAGCSYTPPEKAVEAVVKEHFESRNYGVLELRLGRISRLPVREREYMAPKTFVVEISSIKLETMSEVSMGYRFHEIISVKGPRVQICRAGQTQCLRRQPCLI